MAYAGRGCGIVYPFYALLNGGQSIAGIQVNDRAIFQQCFGEFVVDHHAFIRVEFKPSLLQELIDFRIIVVNEIELARLVLGGVPNAELVWIQG